MVIIFIIIFLVNYYAAIQVLFVQYHVISTVGLVVWLSGNAFDSINEVTVCQAGLVLRWVIACRQVNHLGM